MIINSKLILRQDSTCFAQTTPCAKSSFTYELAFYAHNFAEKQKNQGPNVFKILSEGSP